MAFPSRVPSEVGRCTFTAVRGEYDCDRGPGRYEVRLDGVLLGCVVRGYRSTDRATGQGKRLRIPGKGADQWHAQVPREHWDHPRDYRTGELRTTLPKTAGLLGGGYAGDRGPDRWRLEEFERSARSFDRRWEAAEVLLEWARERGPLR